MHKLANKVRLWEGVLPVLNKPSIGVNFRMCLFCERPLSRKLSESPRRATSQKDTRASRFAARGDDGGGSSANPFKHGSSGAAAFEAQHPARSAAVPHVVLAGFSRQITRNLEKESLHILRVLGRSLEEAHVVAVGKVLTYPLGNLAIGYSIAFVAWRCTDVNGIRWQNIQIYI